jgi:hypothetical protein
MSETGGADANFHRPSFSIADVFSRLGFWLFRVWIPRVGIFVGMERRPDNVQVMKDFFCVDVVNDGLFKVVVADVSITYRAPYRRTTIKSIIVAEEQAYPLTLRPGERLRVNLLPSLVDLRRVDFISVNLGSGREFRLESRAPEASRPARTSVECPA